MSWGIKITAVYLSFVGLIVFLIIRTTHENVDLVSEDYYQQELQYQDKIDQQTMAAAKHVQPTVSVTQEHVKIIFPGNAAQPVKGVAFFYRASDATKDVKVELNPSADGVQLIDIAQFAQGHYQLKLSWSAGTGSYYHEFQLYIP